MNPRQISEHTGFQEPDALTVQRASGYLHNSAKDTGFQELFEAHSGFPELHLQPFGISGTIIGVSGTIFGLLGTKRRVIMNPNYWVFRNQAFGVSGTEETKKNTKSRPNLASTSPLTYARDLNRTLTL